jgi:hypothetical protein
MRSGNYFPKLQRFILANLATSKAVRVKCARPRKLAERLRKELRMCDVKIESETPSNGALRIPAQGVLVITWKAIP